MIGRTAARLVDIHIEIQPSSWRVTRRPGMDAQRANDFWAWDLDALQVAADGYAGPLKIQLVGPWTLAASLELVNGHRFLTDEGALRDLQESLGEGAAQLLHEIKRRVPGAQPILQLDEPSLPAVLGGSVPTASGFGRISAVGSHEAGLGLERVIRAVAAASDGADLPRPDATIGTPAPSGADRLSADPGRVAAASDGADRLSADSRRVAPASDEAARLSADAGRVAAAVSGGVVPVIVHCCAPKAPVGLLRQAGAAAAMLDASLLTEREYDDLGSAVDEGLGLFLGVIPSRRAVRRGDVDAAAARVREIASAVGIPSAELTSRIGLTTACGLAGVTWDQAVAATRAVVAASRQIADNPTPE